MRRLSANARNATAANLNVASAALNRRYGSAQTRTVQSRMLPVEENPMTPAAQPLTADAGPLSPWSMRRGGRQVDLAVSGHSWSTDLWTPWSAPPVTPKLAAAPN